MVRRNDSGETSFRAALNSGNSERFNSLMTSRARSRDSTSCTWLVTVSGSTVPRSISQLFGFRPQEDVFPALDQHARFGFEPRRHEVDGDEGCGCDQYRRPDDRTLVAPYRPRHRAETDLVAGIGLPSALNATTHADSVPVELGRNFAGP